MKRHQKEMESHEVENREKESEQDIKFGEEIGNEIKGAVCPNCGLLQDRWTGNSGEGYEKQGLIFCCEGCAEDTGCGCVEEMER